MEQRQQCQYPRGLTKEQYVKVTAMTDMLVNPNDDIWKHVFISVLTRMTNEPFDEFLQKMGSGEAYPTPTIPPNMSQTLGLVTGKIKLEY